MDLFDNPFYKLKITTRDNKRVIMEKANEMSLTFNDDGFKQASADLTNPRKRLKAEIAWMPGIGPKRANEFLTLIESSPSELLKMKKVAPIVWANIAAAALSRLPDYNSNIVSDWIIELTRTYEKIKPDQLCALINEDRVVSGFPEIQDISKIERELQQQRQLYGQNIKKALNNLFAKDLIDAVTGIVASETASGENHGSIIVHDMVDIFETEAQTFFHNEKKYIEKLIMEIGIAVEEEVSDTKINAIMIKLKSSLNNWYYVAQPIQISAKSLGLKHELSKEVAGSIRNLAIELFNDHNRIDLAQDLTAMLQEIFIEVTEIAELVEGDALHLQKFADSTKIDNLLEPIIRLCKESIEFAEKNPAKANKQAQKVIEVASNLINELYSANSPTEIISQGKNWVAFTLMQCAIAYGNHTSKWHECKKLIDIAEDYVKDPDLLSDIEKNKRIVMENIINNRF